MSKGILPSLLERHWAESALAIGAVVIAAVSMSQVRAPCGSSSIAEP